MASRDGDRKVVQVPGLDVLFRADIHRLVLAGIVLSIQDALHQGYAPLYVAGILANAQHNSLAAGVSWKGVLDEAREELETDHCQLLEAALKLRTGGTEALYEHRSTVPSTGSHRVR